MEKNAPALAWTGAVSSAGEGLRLGERAEDSRHFSKIGVASLVPQRILRPLFTGASQEICALCLSSNPHAAVFRAAAHSAIIKCPVCSLFLPMRT